MGNNENAFSKFQQWTLIGTFFGIIATLFLGELNRRSNIELEEKKVEATLFMQAIQVNDKKSTLDNLKFLLKMGILSKERELAIQCLSDSIYLEQESEIFTKSDTVSFVDITVQNNRKEGVYYNKVIRGAYVSIENIDNSLPLKLYGYTDNYGKIEFYYPKLFEDKFIKIKIVKKGYKSKEMEMRLPNENHLSDFQKILTLDNE